MTASPSDPAPLHDHALAKLFVDQHGSEIRYLAGRKRPSWYIKDGAIWRQDTLRRVEYRVREFLSSLNGDGDLRLGGDRTIRAVLSQAGNDPRITVSYDALDNDSHLLGTPGGIVDLRSGDFCDATSDPLVSKSTSVAPEFDAPPRAWRKFLKQITMNDEELIRYLQTWCGYCLTGETADHAMLILYGSGRNGKSTFVEVLRDILAEYAKVPDRNLFVAGGRSAHFSATSHLIGARLVAVPEIEKGAVWNESLLKSFTGGDTIDSKGMWADQNDFRPSGKLVVGTNHLPNPKAVNKALVQRLQILELLFSANDPDTSLRSRLEAEYPAILAWMIGGAKRFYRRFDKGKKGVKVPRPVLDTTADYFAQFDYFNQWWVTFIVESDKAATQSSEIASSFNAFLLEQGQQSWSSVEIGKSMSGKGYRAKSERVRGVQTRLHHGVRLRQKPNSEKKR